MKREELYVLVRRKAVLAVNWSDWGRKGVYSGNGYKPEPGDRIMKVRQVTRKTRRANERK